MVGCVLAVVLGGGAVRPRAADVRIPPEEETETAGGTGGEASTAGAGLSDLSSRCARMTRTACMASAECTLVLVEPEEVGSYACRPAQGPCEVDRVQARLAEDPGRCTRRAGCSYQQPRCHCRCRGYGRTTVLDGDEAEDCDCECGGGLPPACVPGDGP